MNSRLSLLTPAISVALFSAVASAQESGAPAQDGLRATNDEAQVLPTTVVTARMWEEQTAEVPQSLSVLDGSDLRDAGITSIRDASLRVPNLFVNEFSNRRLSFPTMRGIGSGQGDPAVTTYIGGVPQLTTNSTNIPLIDVERIEFLRGPQSTLYGRNALGGVIHIVPRRPSSTLEGDGTFTMGNHGLRELNLSGSGPLPGDELYFRVAAQNSRRDGYTTNDTTGNDVDYRDSTFGRASFLWAPEENWELQLTLHGEHSRDGGFVLGDLASLRQRPHHIAQDFEGITERDIFAPALEWTYYGDEFEVTTISAYQDWQTLDLSDFDFSVIDGVRRHTAESQQSFNQEIRFSSPQSEESSSKWLAGINLFAADSSRSAANEYRPGGAGVIFPANQVGTDTPSGEFDDWGLALFGQSSLPLSDAVDLGLGLRLDHESKQADLRRTFVSGGTTFSDTRTHLSADYDEFVPHLSLAWRAAQDVLIYSVASRGFKAGGFNLAAPANRLAFEPETSTNLELGAKLSWLEESVHLNLAVFHIDWDDMQLSLFDATTGGFVDNAGAATSQGFELELIAEALDDLELFGTFGYTKAEFDEYIDPFGANVDGNTLAYAPETTASLGARYVGDIDGRHSWFVQGALQEVGTYYYDAGNRESESFSLLDLRAGVERSAWKLEAWVRNALDEEYVQVAFQPNPNDSSAFVGENGAPLTFGFSLTAGF